MAKPDGIDSVEVDGKNSLFSADLAISAHVAWPKEAPPRRHKVEIILFRVYSLDVFKTPSEELIYLLNLTTFVVFARVCFQTARICVGPPCVCVLELRGVVVGQ